MLLAVLALSPSAPELPQEPAPQTPPAAVEPAWDVGLSAFWVEPPDDDGHNVTILTADRGALHLEARYGYEDEDGKRCETSRPEVNRWPSLALLALLARRCSLSPPSPAG